MNKHLTISSGALVFFMIILGLYALDYSSTPSGMIALVGMIIVGALAILNISICLRNKKDN